MELCALGFALLASLFFLSLFGAGRESLSLVGDLWNRFWNFFSFDGVTTSGVGPSSFSWLFPEPRPACVARRLAAPAAAGEAPE